MSIYIILLALLCVFGLRFRLKNGFEDYMSPQKTGAIKGIFTVIVLISHVRIFATVDSSPLNMMYKDVMSFLGQLIVVAFLFYSGYGIALGLKNKNNYASSIIKKRVPKILLHFDIAVLIYFILSYILGKKYSVPQLLLSFICISNVGNQVWFIFVILVLYILTFAVFIFCKKKMILGTTIFTVLSFLLYFLIMIWKGKEHWWYDTIPCYALGMWYALAKPYIDKQLLNSFWKWILATATTGTAFFVLHNLMKNNGIRMYYFVPAAMLFGILLALLSMRIGLESKILCWFGKRVFSIYMLHYIPMRILTYFGLNQNALLFTAVSLAVTIVLAEIFDRCTDKLDRALKI